MTALPGRRVEAPSLFRPNLAARRLKSQVFELVCAGLTWFGVLLLAVMLVCILAYGWHWLDLQFFTSFPSRHPEKAGILGAFWGTVWTIGLTALFSIPIGIASAVYLEEYATRGRLGTLIEVNIANLAGVPSIVYGMLGLAIFYYAMGFGDSILTGSLTMTLLILPVIIIAAREAIRAVPDTLRQGAFALGATRWQTVYGHVLPAALPGILTGVILALSRAMGETAPLLMLGAIAYVAFVPESPMDGFTTLPIQIYNWASRPGKEFEGLAAAGILVLLAVLLFMNAIAVAIRYRAQRNRAW